MKKRILLSALVTIALAAPAWGQKIKAPNPLRGADFGDSIAIDNGFIAVGAPRGDLSGAVYIFDSATNTQVAKLLPADNTFQQRFGTSVAMSNNIVAIGSWADSSNGDRAGSAYLFDRITGTQLFKLLPNDGAPIDFFGISIDIHNGLVAVGAHFDNDNGLASGSAYVFDAATGQQIVKLLPNDGAELDHFGETVAIHNGLVVVGAPADDDNGENSGSAYVFDAITGVQLAKLFPSDGEVLRSFGRSVDIFNGVAAVTAFEVNTSTGAAYLFNAFTGVQLVKVQPNDDIRGQFFGTSIALDNTVIAVGAFGDDVNGSSSGSVYTFNPFTGVQIGKIHTTEPDADGDQLGFAVALHNGVLATSAPTDDANGNNTGSAYAFTISTTTQIAKFLPEDGTFFDNFGNSVALDNDIMVIGASREDDHGIFSGSAYLYNVTSTNPYARLVPDDGGPAEFFGNSTAISNNTVLIGANWDDDNGLKSGSAYLFDATTGNQIAKLLPNDGAPEDWFGISVAIDNNIAVVGSWYDDDNGFQSGSAYLFDATTGAQIRKLLPDDGAFDDRFGISVAIHNGIVAVGSRHDDDTGTDSGSAYLFDAATGTQLAKLLPDDGQAQAFFGSSIAIDNDTVAVGAIWANQVGIKSGAAYLFDVPTGIQIATLIPDDLADGDRFGSSIDIDNNIVSVGSMLNDGSETESGSAYLFDATTSEQLDKLLPWASSNGARFGSTIAIDNGFIVTGAYADDENGDNAGAAYVIDTNPVPCYADLTGDGDLDFFDFVIFITAFGNNDPIADFTGDGFLDFNDIVSFLSAFSAGCP